MADGPCDAGGVCGDGGVGAIAALLAVLAALTMLLVFVVNGGWWVHLGGGRGGV